MCCAICRVELSRIKKPMRLETTANSYLGIDKDLQKKAAEEKVDFQLKRFARYLKATTWEM